MQPSSPADLVSLHQGPFAALLQEEWATWRSNYIEQVRAVRDADQTTWCDPAFQQRLWDRAAVSSVGPGQSVTLVGAYEDEELATKLFKARGSLDSLTLEQRGARLQALYDETLAHVYPRYTPRRPKARLARLLAAMFPNDMTCLMDAARVWGVQRLLGAVRLPGDFIAQHPALRVRLREVLGSSTAIEDNVEQSMFTWFLWQEAVDRPDEGSVPVQPPRREPTRYPRSRFSPPTRSGAASHA